MWNVWTAKFFSKLCQDCIKTPVLHVLCLGQNWPPPPQKKINYEMINKRNNLCVGFGSTIESKKLLFVMVAPSSHTQKPWWNYFLSQSAKNQTHLKTFHHFHWYYWEIWSVFFFFNNDARSTSDNEKKLTHYRNRRTSTNRVLSIHRTIVI